MNSTIYISKYNLQDNWGNFHFHYRISETRWLLHWSIPSVKFGFISSLFCCQSWTTSSKFPISFELLISTLYNFSSFSQHPNVNNQQNYRRIPSPTKPVDAAPALWNVRKKSHAEQLAVKVASRLEAPSLTKDTKNDPVHAYYYLSSAGLKINPKSTKTEVTMLNSDSKSDPTDQRDKEHGEAIPLLDHFSEEKVSGLILRALSVPACNWRVLPQKLIPKSKMS